jgi:hypothetical protein
MNPPIDYPIDDEKEPSQQSLPVTYATLMDRYASEEVITNGMIQSACTSMETAQQFPQATKAEPVIQSVSSPLFKRVFNIIR